MLNAPRREATVSYDLQCSVCTSVVFWARKGNPLASPPTQWLNTSSQESLLQHPCSGKHFFYTAVFSPVLLLAQLS